MRKQAVVATLLGCIFMSPPVWPQSLGDLLKGAIQDYADKKAEEAGLSGDNNSESSVTAKSGQSVSVSFIGNDVPSPDVFRSLYSNKAPVRTNPETAAERDCFQRFQNKIAWDYSGHKSWSPSNIKSICKGTTKPQQTASCFSRAMFNGAQWGKKNTHVMNWSLAGRLCAGANNANAKITCLKQKIAQGKSLNQAVKACGSGGGPAVIKPLLVNKAFLAAPVYVAPQQTNKSAQVANPTVKRTYAGSVNSALIAKSISKEQQCFNNIQGKIAWDPDGRAKTWGASNIERLCKGTTSAAAPGACFNYAMRNTAAWGKTAAHIMDWKKAIDLCEGSSNANATTNCFKSAIAAGKSLGQAIRQCEA